MRLGRLELIPLLDGLFRLDGGAMFGVVPRTLWARRAPADDRNRITMAMRPLLVRGDRLMIIDAGIGDKMDPKLADIYGIDRTENLDVTLAGAGVRAEDIEIVLASHLHFDHAGGLLAAFEDGHPPRLLFPNARFVVGRRAWERARNPHPRDRASFIAALPALLEQSGRLELVDGARTASLGDEVRFEYTDGHTPGLTHAEIGGDGGVVFCSDLIPGRPWVHAPVTMGYDRYPEQLVDEKSRFLEDKISRGVRLFFTHDLGCALALPTRGDAGRYGVTAERESVEALEL